MKRVVIIDAQGGGIGKQLVTEIRKRELDVDITAIGANAAATAVMIKAGADRGASGENPVVVACKKAEVIMGPIGIVVADAMLGEITEKMAVAVGKSDAEKILIPINHCSNFVAGVAKGTMRTVIEDAVDYLVSLL